VTKRAPRPDAKPGAAPPPSGSPARATSSRAARPPFPIVGIGTSAGGLEALEQFFKGVPAASGLAFVVIQHLDPTHQGMLPELLQRVTPMKVAQAADRMPVKPDCVYVIPPNKNLSILRGVLHLLELEAPRGARLPIDFFLRALADDQRERSIGVILSGMGSDGTLGVRAIKEVAGLVLAQDPASARFDSMPRHVIDAGMADIVAPAHELAQRILETTRHVATTRTAPEPERPPHEGGLDKILILLRARSGQDFSLYKKNTLYRRIERRMSVHQLDTIEAYVHFLGENPQELDLLFKELLIGVTNFFRDPPAWACLQEQGLPALLADCPDGRILRAWVVACSTGEEAYSLAISFSEAIDRAGRTGRVMLQIFATDLDQDAIDRARQGLYPANIAADLSSKRLARFFNDENGAYRVRKEIREMVVFAPHNVAMDPPFTKLDILTCRNLLIYLGPELQAKLLPLFHFSLNPGGILFLGSAEAVGRFGDLFVPMDPKARLFRRSDGSLRAIDMEFPSKHVPIERGAANLQPAPPILNLQSLAEQLLLQRFAPAAVLVNATGDILYISGRTGKYLEPAAGKANWNIYPMAREGLRHELMITLPKALRDREPVTRPGIRVDTDGGPRSIDLTVHPVDEPQALRGMAMIVFSDVPAAPPAPAPAAGTGRSGSKRVTELELALKRAHEELQAAREQMQTREEELRSTTEEFQSTNEELQSTNEELTTSKEEMQSLNEELQTLNAELQSKVDELSLASNDMKNLLNSIDVAIVFLDNALHVRRFTTQLTRMFKLIPGDVGRPLSDIATDLDYPALQDDAREVLRTLVLSDKEIPTRDGRWFHVKTMPYRTADNVIDGVVMTFTDISGAKKLEAVLRADTEDGEPAG
jgi:two-component system CheB/CheR fusion protein